MSRLSDFKALLRFEFSTSYRQPGLEFLVALILLFSAFGVSSSAFQSLSVRFSPDFLVHYPDLFADFLSAVKRLGVVSLVAGIKSVYYILVFLIPMFSAFTIASSIENGSLAALISYPVSRRSALLVRVLFPIVFLGASTFICSLIWVGIFLPGVIDLGFYLFAFVLTFTAIMFIFLINSLIAILSKRASVSVVGGFVLGMVFLQLGYMSDTTLAGVLDPFTLLVSILTISNYELGFFDIIASMCIQVSLSIILLVVQLKIFNRMEVL
jgi:hypothetical protein